MATVHITPSFTRPNPLSLPPALSLLTLHPQNRTNIAASRINGLILRSGSSARRLSANVPLDVPVWAFVVVEYHCVTNA